MTAKCSKGEQKRLREQETVSMMIRLYCRKNHKVGNDVKSKGEILCPECQELLAYAEKKIQRCPFMENKTFCSNCRVHCYQSEMREKIRDVMRFSGPRMLLYHPFMALHHLWCTLREKNKEAKRHD
ncbi:nitrous oxide-stimulated promoter family protein [uncultured Robinsoniella sp.]|uniref:nitrous oxide-stimulated promoter family protein n=1 Tax=uncultured Robinsoniella sp. TaxID=904190 RepID=UPI00374E5429